MFTGYGFAEISGVRIERAAMDAFVDWLAAAASLGRRDGSPFTIAHVNAFSLVEAQRNPAHMAALADALCLADGIGVALLAHTPKIAGADLMLAAARHPELGKMRHVLLGGFGVAYQAAILQWWNAAGVILVEKPWIPDTPAHDDLVEWANGVPCDILWIAFGCPKQEIWMQENRHRLKAKVVIAVGAAFDFLAGRIPRAPGWMQGIGLEWGWRIWQEPTRWRRQVDAAVGFLRLLCR